MKGRTRSDGLRGPSKAVGWAGSRGNLIALLRVVVECLKGGTDESEGTWCWGVK